MHEEDMEDLFQGTSYPVNNTAAISNDVGSSPAVHSTIPTSGPGTASPVNHVVTPHSSETNAALVISSGGVTIPTPVIVSTPCTSHVLKSSVVPPNVGSSPAVNSTMTTSDASETNAALVTSGGGVTIPTSVIVSTPCTSHVIKSSVVPPSPTFTRCSVNKSSDGLPPVNFIIQKSKVSCDEAESISISLSTLLAEKCVESLTCEQLSPVINDSLLEEAEESSGEDEPVIQSIKVVKNLKVVKKLVDLQKLQNYLEEHREYLVSLSPQSVNKEEIVELYNQLELYEKETKLITAYLQKHSSKFNHNRHTSKYIDECGSVCLNVLNQYLQFETKSDRETSPKRIEIRNAVRNNIRKSAEKMKEQYGKRKRLKIGIFKESDNVSVMIPKEDRGKVELRRIPAVVVKVKGSLSHPLYLLACKFGTLEGLFTASKLKSYPGAVDLDSSAVNDYISLRSAAKMYAKRKDDIVICKCRKGCSNNRCPCKRGNLLCTSRCHKGYACSNKEKAVGNNVNEFPPYGGSIIHNEVCYKFYNTCPIDNWLAIFGAIAVCYPNIFDEILIETDGENMSTMLELVKEKCYMLAKLELGKINGLVAVDNCYDFFGTEKDRFLEHILVLTEYSYQSVCSNSYCPQRSVDVKNNKNFPAMCGNENDTALFIEEILHWLMESWVGRCGKKYSCPPPEDALVLWDVNNET